MKRFPTISNAVFGLCTALFACSGILLPLFSVSSCAKDEAQFEQQTSVKIPERAQMMVPEKPGGLIQQENYMWKAENVRVPLVGPGRIINDVNNQVKVISAGSERVGNVVDEDLKNQYSVPVTIGANVAYVPIVSVKDLHRVYAGNQKVGFVYKDNGGEGLELLSAELLKKLTLTTYLDGEKQESSINDNGESILSLDLLSSNMKDQVANREVSFMAKKPFDEVVLGMAGVKLNSLSTISLAVKYAFVGENTEIRATSESAFRSFWTGAAPKVSSDIGIVSGKNNVTDSILTNYAASGVILGVVGSSSVTVDFGREIPAGYEAGFYYTNEKLLALDFLGSSGAHLYGQDAGGKETDKAEPGKSLVSVSLIGGASKGFVNMELTQPCHKLKLKVESGILSGGVDLGAAHYYYAYVKEGIKSDPANEFTFGNDTTYSNSYRLPAAEKGSVQYFILDKPYGSSPAISRLGSRFMLDGMTLDGAYRVQALYTSGTDGRQVSHISTIYRKSESLETGSINITARTHGAYAAEPIGWHGSLLNLFSGSNNLNNVVDSDSGNYAVAYNMVSLLDWSPVASFSMNVPVGGDGELRTGFVVRANTHLLDLTALQFFKIKLYKAGSLVYESATSGNSTVKLSLLGYDRDKVRLNVVTDKEFDRIELWTKGAATLMEALRIYNIFYEDSSIETTSEAGGGFELMTNVKDGLVIDYDGSDLDAILALEGKATDMSKMLDGSVASGTLFQSLLELGAKKIALAFEQKEAGCPVGIILAEVPNLLNLNLAKIGIFRACDGDREVATTANLEILGADLISHKGRTYIEVTPTEKYDRVEFVIGGLELMGNMRICGIYSRNIENERGAGNNLLTVNDGFYHSCYSSPLNLSYVRTSTSLQPGTEVSLYCSDVDDPSVFVRIPAVLDENSVAIAPETLPVGRYNVKVYSMEGIPLTSNSGIVAIVHPDRTTWKTDALSKDWNEWNNWSEGSPWYCTDVTMPANASVYPEITPIQDCKCNNIYFRSGAETVGTQYLDIRGKAFLDLSLQGGRYYLLSLPLQEAYTGDMFINPSVPYGNIGSFVPLSMENYPEMRTSPEVYQRFWSSSATEKIIAQDGTLQGVEVGTARWSDTFNALALKYAPAQGFSLRAGSENEFNSYTFRFPKTHLSYTYYTHDGTSTGKTENVERSAVGRLQTPPGDLVLKNKGGRIFLMGNPMMCHIDVQAFLKKNTNVSHLMTYDGNSYNPLIEVDGNLVSSAVSADMKIAPFEAFFVVAVNDSLSLPVRLDESMLCQSTASAPLPPAVSRSYSAGNASSLPVLRIMASSGADAVSCALVRSSSFSRGTESSSGAMLFTESLGAPSMAVFTEESQRAYSILETSKEAGIPLGFLMRRPGPVTLIFGKEGAGWDEWRLTDTETGMTYKLDGRLTFDNVSSGSTRFRLGKIGER